MRPGSTASWQQVGQAAERVGPLAEKLETLATNVDEVVRAVDRERVARIVENVDNFTTSLSDSRKDISQALADAATLVGRLNDSAPKLEFRRSPRSTTSPRRSTPPRSDASSTTRTCSARPCGTAARTWTRRSARRAPSPRSSTSPPTRSTAVLAGAEKFLGSASGEEGQGAFEQIKAAASPVRVLADNLNQRTAGILSGVGKFTDSGLREYEALAVEGRKTLNDISRAVRSIERNPQQFIFGGKPGIPEYNGRR